MTELPAGWTRGNIRRFAAMKTGHTPSRSAPSYWENGDVPWFTLADVWQLRDDKKTYLGETSSVITTDGLANSSAELLPTGTVVLSRTASVGFSGVMPRPMATSQDFWNWVCGPRLLPEFLNYQFKSMRSELRALNMGSTHQTIYQRDAAAIQIVVPPLPQQRAIANYLDRETAHIDALIAEQEQLLALLTERRRAVVASNIRHAFADPQVSHGTLRRIGKFTTGSTPTGALDEYFDDFGRIGWARPEDLGGLTEPSKRLSRSGEQAVRLVGPAVLVCCVGATVGKVGWTDQAVSTNQQITAISMDGQDPEFWYYALTALRDEVLRLTVGNTIPILNNERLASLRVAIPHREHQRRVAATIRDSCNSIDRLHGEVALAIDLARERRAALITAAVTGQVAIPS